MSFQPCSDSKSSLAISRQNIFQGGFFSSSSFFFLFFRLLLFKEDKGAGVWQLQKSQGARLPNTLSLWHWKPLREELPLICSDGGYDG